MDSKVEDKKFLDETELKDLYTALHTTVFEYAANRKANIKQYQDIAEAYPDDTKLKECVDKVKD